MDITLLVAWLAASGLLGVAAYMLTQRGADVPRFLILSLCASPVVAAIELGRTTKKGSPTSVPAMEVLAALVTGPLLLLIAQRVLLGRDATEMMLPLLAGTGAATAIRLSVTLRDLSTAELIAWVKPRPRVWQVAVGVLAFSEVIAAGRSIIQYVRHRSVAAAIGNKSACGAVSAWHALKPGELESASSSDREEAARLEGACNDQLATIANLEAQKKAAAAARAYATRCSEVVRHIAEGKLTDADSATLLQTPLVADATAYFDGNLGSAFGDRIAKKELSFDDLGSAKRLPCGPAARPAFFQAAAASKATWAGLTNASIDSGVLLGLGATPALAWEQGVKVETPLSADSKVALHKNAEDSASKADAAKTSADCGSAVTLCALDARFATKQGAKCAAVVQLSARLKKAEDAAAAAAKAADDAKTKADADRAEATRKAEAAAAEAKTAACDRETKNWQACNRSCDDLLLNGNGNDDAVLACEDRCNAAHKKPSCN
jgi:hypothetical protein